MADRRTSVHGADPTGAAQPAAASLAQALYARLAAHARLRQLQLLVALDEQGSIARAASRLHLSQPAATQARAELERIVGIQLFERHARGVRATAAGRSLLAAARGALAGVRETAETIAALSHGATAALRLGAIPAAAHALVAELLAVFCAARPGVHIDLYEDSGGRLLPLLTAGSLDAVFCREPEVLPAQCRFDALLADEVVVVAARGHALAARRGLALPDLADACWVLPAPQTQLRQVFEELTASALPQARWFAVATASLPVVAGMLLQPGALALLPASLSTALCANGQLCRLDLALRRPLRPLGVAYDAAQAPALLHELLSTPIQRASARRSGGAQARAQR